MTHAFVDLPFEGTLPRHAAVVRRLAAAVHGNERLRWLELCCSLAAGRADELSDVDAGVGYEADLSEAELEAEGMALVQAAGEADDGLGVLDVLVHVLPGWPPETTRRFAVEYGSGVQLDLVLLPAGRRQGLPEGALAVVDKDGRLVQPWRPRVADPPDAGQAREWAMFAWWALSDAAKYLRRGSPYEAAERVAEARTQALRLVAVARRVAYPSFGLPSLLDADPPALPDGLAGTYGLPADPASLRAAALATAALLRNAAAGAGEVLGADLDTVWAAKADARLAALPG